MAEKDFDVTPVAAKKKNKHTARNVMLILLAVIVLLGGAVYGAFLHFYGKTDYVPDDQVTEIRIPEDGTWTSQGEILVPKDINAVIRSLRDRLYGE